MNAILKAQLRNGIAYLERTGEQPSFDWMIEVAERHNLSLVAIKTIFKELEEDMLCNS
ncbi:hypothetical protein FP74_gp166 [Bacillus phage CAM003]|uniref:Uncharacterized protein n=5 Tax=Bastillevirus TaxID=1918010 RepID=A0A024AZN5_9CAUD|nr:hypothetical protein FP74_gp166 [Bacillus phage CAM003]AHZ09630.1 hypothetical protein [Bacillus phage CAM003]ASR79543.1 hypothetical protein OTK52_198 [Bacillus phage OTooleKemple52]ASU01046.1 hypothetical protein ANTHONY_206 [Bacillus phage Anthony]AXQ67147.1 hypothetical protein KAMFAM_200 [Bacillus phage Kamfam]